MTKQCYKATLTLLWILTKDEGEERGKRGKVLYSKKHIQIVWREINFVIKFQIDFKILSYCVFFVDKKKCCLVQSLLEKRQRRE
mmetsp:Transcript_6115/g.9121  ORF Transcript_6115/g.9121 Transcript_6115/m.9121 type:complete len:84 (-) Transcript_6115:262-513(-)